MKNKLIVLTLIAGGGLAGLWAVGEFIRWKSPQIVLPQSQIETAFEAVQQKTSAEAEAEQNARRANAIENELMAAHAAVKVAQGDWARADASLACARGQHLFAKWQKWADETGQSLERIYRDEFAAHLTRIRDWQQQNNGGIVGSPERIGDARALVMDTQVFLMLGDLLYSQKSAPLCDNAIDAEIVQLGLVYSEVAARVDTRQDNLKRIEQAQLTEAANYWAEATGQSTDEETEAKPVEYSAPSRIKQFLYGDGAND